MDTKRPALILGDFNVPSIFWGYKQESPKGKQLREAMEDAGFTLLNTPDQHTRIGGARQNNKSPDLTWVRYLPKSTHWDTWPDNIGSDHLPIVITWGKISSQATESSFIDWDKYRFYMDGCPQALTLQELTEHTREATRKASTIYEKAPQKPAPDRHLLNLWEARIDALHAIR
ncbi:hypothetical protein HPB49_019450 [Dermacentor silvarum]|uniref:Uncharacterized protein n=1 Tax=Dermacentor silvarum TaxID=543639 RepID=A0ACB8DFF8_DERSI|nr:hypothetical protein HPB49_019450 [Dermacentor silvarum]